MRTDRWLVALVALIGGGALAVAQGPFFGNPYFGGGLSYSRGGLRVGVGFRGPPPFDPFFAPGIVRRVTYFSVYAPPPPPPIIIVRPPPIIIEAPPPPPRETDTPPPVPEIPPVPEVPPVPDIPPMPREPVPMPPPPKEKPKDKPKAPADPDDLGLPRRDEPLADTAEESGRLIRQGREDFSQGMYGRAALRFRQARRLQPEAGLPSFLLAQALLALGKYHEAGDAVAEGLRRSPNWPRSDFRPIDLYGANVADYSEHLQTLDDVRERHPDDTTLLFLAGYARWFDGRREEARDLFRQARPRLPDGELIERFLLALPPAGAI